MPESTRFIAGKLESSITTQTGSVSAADRIVPLSFTEWVMYRDWETDRKSVV